MEDLRFSSPSKKREMPKLGGKPITFLVIIGNFFRGVYAIIGLIIPATNFQQSKSLKFGLWIGDLF